MALGKRDPIEDKLDAAKAARETKIAEIASATQTPVHVIREPAEPAPGEGGAYVPPTYTPPERIDTEQLNVRIDRRLVDAAKAKHRATGESMKGIVTRALTALLTTEGDL